MTSTPIILSSTCHTCVGPLGRYLSENFSLVRSKLFYSFSHKNRGPPPFMMDTGVVRFLFVKMCLGALSTLGLAAGNAHAVAGVGRIDILAAARARLGALGRAGREADGVKAVLALSVFGVARRDRLAALAARAIVHGGRITGSLEKKRKKKVL